MKILYVFAVVLLVAMFSLPFAGGCKREQTAFLEKTTEHPFSPLTNNGHLYLKYTEVGTPMYHMSVVHDPDCPCLKEKK